MSFKTEKKADAHAEKVIRLACVYAIKIFEKEWKPIQSSVAQVRLSL